MLDVNLGNKTLIVGVVIALILSYGMVNFDSGKSDSAGFRSVHASTIQPYRPAQEVASVPVATAPTPLASADTTPIETATATDIDTDALSGLQQNTAETSGIIHARNVPLKWRD